MSQKNTRIRVLAYPFLMMLMLSASCSQEKKDIAPQTLATEQTPAPAATPEIPVTAETPDTSSATPALEAKPASPAPNPTPVVTKPTPTKPVVSDNMPLQGDGTVVMKVGQSTKISS
ncbi:MAG: hypothetical protein ABIM73_04360, partial [Arenimonas sp.]